MITMAFSAVILRAAASASAARAIVGCRQNYQSYSVAALFRRSSNKLLLNPRSVLSYRGQILDFSSFSPNKSSDSELVKLIESEIKCDVHDLVQEIPEGFPFEIQDEEGKDIILLKRAYQDEKIKIRVSMPSLVTGEEPEDIEVCDDEKPSQSSIPLTVSVNKGQGPSLEFHCTAYPDELVIDAMSVREVPNDEEMLSYEGPIFSDLDENLQKAFHKYLEVRGISAITTNFLHEYMINKDSQEYLLWLRNLKEFVEK